MRRRPDTGPTGYVDHGSRTTRLIVVSGVPGSGKRTLADALGGELGIPVFAGSTDPRTALAVGTELLTHLTLRQLLLDQSAILDHPVEEMATRRRWNSLAQRFGACFNVVWVPCPDEEMHRQRVEQRSRAIPGWHDAGHWPSVVERRERFPA